MKKYLLLLSICCSQYANCIYDLESLQSSYIGWYAGVGLSYQHQKGNVLLNDNAFTTLVPGTYVNNVNRSINKKHFGRAGGTLLTGFGTFINWGIYIGTEFTLDFAKNKISTTPREEDQHNGILPIHITSVKTKGTVPTISLRLGGYSPSISTMFYLKLGGSFTDNKFETNSFKDQSLKNKHLIPVLGIGLEKSIASNLNVRFEIDYRFQSKKEKSNLIGYYLNENTNSFEPVSDLGFPNYRASLKGKYKGLSARLLTTFHF